MDPGAVLQRLKWLFHHDPPSMHLASGCPVGPTEMVDERRALQREGIIARSLLSKLLGGDDVLISFLLSSRVLVKLSLHEFAVARGISVATESIPLLLESGSAVAFVLKRTPLHFRVFIRAALLKVWEQSGPNNND